MIVIVFGILFGYKKSRTGFVTGFIILLMTTKSAYAVLKHLPGSQYLWMLRFISIALCMILMSFLMWDRLKKTLVLMLCVLLVVDTIPSLSLIVGEHNDISVQERMAARQDTYFKCSGSHKAETCPDGREHTGGNRFMAGF